MSTSRRLDPYRAEKIETDQGLPPPTLADAEDAPWAVTVCDERRAWDDEEEAAAGGVWDEASCWVCGCTDGAACEGGCWWVPDARGDLCSACEEELIALEDRLAQLLALPEASALAEGLGALGLAALEVDGAVRLPGGAWLHREGEGGSRWWCGRDPEASEATLLAFDLVAELAYRVVRAQQEAWEVGDGC